MNAKNRNPELLAPLSKIQKYHIRYSIFLASVPLICGSVLLLLLWVFTKLNLYFLESRGMVLDPQVREAYFSQVQMETFAVIGYLVLQVAVSLVASFLVMRWATAPFATSERQVRTALKTPDKLKPEVNWMSESPAFDRLIWQFCLRIKAGGENTVKELPNFGLNYPFLIKYFLTYGALSISTGYVLSIIMDTIYRRIIDLGLQLVKANDIGQHYFLAQQDILKDATYFTMIFSVCIYLYIGVLISNQMSNMLFVFSRAIKDDKFPIYLRMGDLYTGLAETLNEGREKIK